MKIEGILAISNLFNETFLLYLSIDFPIRSLANNYEFLTFSASIL